MTDTRQWTRSTLSLLETMPDAVVVVDATGSVVYANRLIEQVFGYSPDALVGRSVEILVPEEARQRHRGQRTDYGQAPAARPMGAVSHVLGLHKSGREFPADISLSPIESDEGWLVIAAVRDMTDRHRIETALRETNEKLGQANEKLGRDLTAAAKIQKSLLPGRPAGIPGVEVDWIYEPCEKLGGDSFNAFEIAAGLVGFYLLDVAGHGTVAALHSMALTRVLASTWTAEERSSPAQLIKRLNAEFPYRPGDWAVLHVSSAACSTRRRARCAMPAPGILARSTCRATARRPHWKPLDYRSDSSPMPITTSTRRVSPTRRPALPLLRRRDGGDERRA